MNNMMHGSCKLSKIGNIGFNFSFEYVQAVTLSNRQRYLIPNLCSCILKATLICSTITFWF